MSVKKNSIETIGDDQVEQREEISSNELLDCPLEINEIDWMLYQNEPIDFFWMLNDFTYFFANIL